MAVRIRMKKLGRRHRPYYRICAIDSRTPRDGRVLEELGTYDPTIPEIDARALLKNERVDYWLGVGAQPSDKVAVLIKKYGTEGTHAEAQRAALERLAQPTPIPDPGKPASLPKSKESPAPPPPAEEAAAPSAEQQPEAASEEAPASEAPAQEQAEAQHEETKEAPPEEGKEEEKNPS